MECCRDFSGWSMAGLNTGGTRGRVFSEQLAAPSSQGMLCIASVACMCLAGVCYVGQLLACSAYAVFVQVNEEKAALESRLTSEQEYLDNQLQKKVGRW